MSSSPQATVSPSTFQSIVDALIDYSEKTGIDLANNPFADKLQLSNSPDDILQLLQERENAFKQYRNRNRTLIRCLSPAVRVLHAFSATLGEAVSLVSHAFLIPSLVSVSVFEFNLARSPSRQQKQYLSALMSSLQWVFCAALEYIPCDEQIFQTASEVSSSYDALLDLFEYLGNFLKRLEIYTHIPATPLMTDMIIKIMIRLLEVLALATRQIKHGRFGKSVITYALTMSQGDVVKFAKKLLGESEVEAVLQRLDRLTQEEARMTVAQTLGVVHGLVNNMRIVMEGAECLLNSSLQFSERTFC